MTPRENPKPPIPPLRSAMGIILFFAAIVLLTLIWRGIELLTDWWWFQEVGYENVFSVTFLTQMKVAALFGLALPLNFDTPYLSASLQEFWRRWHITLSFWFRDYVYIPLGGGRRRLARNLLITMGLAGLWHGAGWPFVVWGAYNGVLLWINQAWQALVPGRPSTAGRAASASWRTTMRTPR